MPSAAIIIIGDEVLSAKINDSNGPFAARLLRRWGVALRRIATVSDKPDDIVAELNHCRSRYDHVFTSGGIGPTHDDVTIAAVAQAFGVPVVRSPLIVEKILAAHGGKAPETLLRLADVPQGTELLLGPLQWLAVIRVDNVYVLPGIPELFEQLFATLETRLRSDPFIGRAIFLTCDEPEIAALLTRVQNAAPEVAIGSYPKLRGEYRTKVTCEGQDSAAVEQVVAALLAEVPAAAVLRVETF